MASLSIEKRWHTLPQAPLVKGHVPNVRSLTDIINPASLDPFYKLLQEEVETPFSDLNADERKWLTSLWKNFDSYMSRVIQTTHFELWDKEYMIRAEYREEYQGNDKESRELPITTIVARLLKYNELMREIVYLRENTKGSCILDLDFYVMPPPATVPIWGTDRFGDSNYHLHGASGSLFEYNENEEGRVGLDPLHHWGYYVDVYGATPYNTYNNGLPTRKPVMACCAEPIGKTNGCWISFDPTQEYGVPVSYQLATEDYWDALSRGQPVVSLNFSKDVRIGTGFQDQVKYQSLHNEIQTLWTGAGGGASIMLDTYIQYVADLDEAIRTQSRLPLNPTDVYIKKVPERLKTIQRLVHLMYAYNDIHAERQPVDIAEYVDKYWFKLGSVIENWTDERRGGVEGKNNTRVRFPPSVFTFETVNTTRLVEILQQFQTNLPHGNIGEQTIVDMWEKNLQSLIDKTTEYATTDVSDTLARVDVVRAELNDKQLFIAFTNAVSNIENEGSAILKAIDDGMRKSLQAQLTVPVDMPAEVTLSEFGKSIETELAKKEQEVKITKVFASATGPNLSNVDLKTVNLVINDQEVNDMYNQLGRVLDEIEKIEKNIDTNIGKANIIYGTPNAILYGQSQIAVDFIAEMDAIILQLSPTKIEIMNLYRELVMVVQGLNKEDDIMAAYKLMKSKYVPVVDNIEKGVVDISKDVTFKNTQYETAIKTAKADYDKNTKLEKQDAIDTAKQYLVKNSAIVKPVDVNNGVQADIFIRLKGQKEVLKDYSQVNSSSAAFKNFANDYITKIGYLEKLAKSTVDPLTSNYIALWNQSIFNYSSKIFPTFDTLLVNYTTSGVPVQQDANDALDSLQAAYVEIDNFIIADKKAASDKAAADKKAAAERAAAEKKAAEEKAAASGGTLTTELPVLQIDTTTSEPIDAFRKNLPPGLQDLVGNGAISIPLDILQATTDEAKYRRTGLLHALWGANRNPTDFDAIAKGMSMMQLGKGEDDEVELFEDEVQKKAAQDKAALEKAAAEKAALEKAALEKAALEKAAAEKAALEKAATEKTALEQAAASGVLNLPIMKIVYKEAINQVRAGLSSELKELVGNGSVPVPDEVFDDDYKRTGLLHALWGATKEQPDYDAIAKGMSMAQLDIEVDDGLELFDVDDVPPPPAGPTPEEEEEERLRLAEEERRLEEESRLLLEEVEKQDTLKALLGGVSVDILPLDTLTTTAINAKLSAPEVQQALGVNTDINFDFLNDRPRVIGLLHALWGVSQNPVNTDAIVRGMSKAQLNMGEEDELELFDDSDE